MPVILKIVITLFCIGVICSLIYLAVEKYTIEEGFEEREKELKSLIKLRKKQMKGKDIDEAELKSVLNRCQHDLDKDHHIRFHKLFTRVDEIADSNDEIDEKIEKMLAVEADLQLLILTHNRKMGSKWYAFILSVVVVWSLIYWAVLPAINFLFLSTKESSVLEE